MRARCVSLRWRGLRPPALPAPSARRYGILSAPEGLLGHQANGQAPAPHTQGTPHTVRRVHERGSGSVRALCEPWHGASCSPSTNALGSPAGRAAMQAVAEEEEYSEEEEEEEEEDEQMEDAEDAGAGEAGRRWRAYRGTTVDLAREKVAKMGFVPSALASRGLPAEEVGSGWATPAKRARLLASLLEHPAWGCGAEEAAAVLAAGGAPLEHTSTGNNVRLSDDEALQD